MSKTPNTNNAKNEKTVESSIKVNISIPSNVRNRQHKINQIYNILKPRSA
jgi:hypothetical protein